MRVPKPFFRKQTRTWYLQLGKRQVSLGPDEAAAWTQYHALMAGREEIKPATSVAVLIDAFLEWCQQNRSPRTYEWYLDHLQSFAKSIGQRLRVADLKPFHVTRWLTDCHKHSAANTRHRAIGAVQRVCNWAIREGHLESSPVARMEKPSPTRRELIIDQQQWTGVLAAATDQQFRDLLITLRETGCRPQEVRLVEACHFDAPGRRWIFPRELSKGKRYSRVVYLNEVALAITQRLAERHPAGPLFRNRLGEPWNRNSIRCRFRAVRDKTNIPGLCA
jgi:integrase